MDEAGASSASASATHEVVRQTDQKLEELARLHAEGVLDEADYQASKARVMQHEKEVLLGETGVEERLAGKAQATSLAAITCGDLAQDVCASGMLAVDHILDVMRSGASAEQAAQGCAGLSSLAERDDRRPTLLAKGAVGLVVSCMAAHAAEPAVQAQGCSALANCAVGEGEASVREQGLDAVLAAMAAHRPDSRVQIKGCTALANLAFSPEGEEAVLARGGASSILEGLRAHPADRKLQEEGCDALMNLACGEAGKREMASLGAAAVVEAAVAAFPSCTSASECLAALQGSVDLA